MGWAGEKIGDELVGLATAQQQQPTLNFEACAPTADTLNAYVLAVLSDGKWYMPYEICNDILATKRIRISDSSCTARLRDLRKAKYGSHVIEKRRRAGSTAYEYKLVM